MLRVERERGFLAAKMWAAGAALIGHSVQESPVSAGQQD